MLWVISDFALLLSSHYNELFLGLVVTGTVSVLLLKGSSPKDGLWESHLQRLRLVNVVAITLFLLSAMKVVFEFDKVAVVDLSIPILGLIASLTYLFGFLGITIISSLLEDNLAVVTKSTIAKSNDVIINSSRNADIIVVGGGCAGCTVALAMARQGRKVIMIERDLQYQDRIVGELLQPGGIRALERLGLDECAKDNIDAVQVHGYVIIDPHAKGPSGETSTRSQLLRYPESDPMNYMEYFGLPSTTSSSSTSNIDLKPRGRSFHHGKFVQRLREKAIQHENIQVIEGNVSKLLEENNVVVGVEYKIKENDETVTKTVRTPITLVADGIWSSNRSKMSDTKLTTASSFIAVIVNHPAMQSPVPHPLHGHVILADPSPCLIYQISPTETRVLVDYLGPLPSTSTGEMQTYLKEKISPQMPEDFRELFNKSIDTNEIKSMPTKFFPAKKSLKRGAFLIGDALNMRHPLTGGGMTVAIRDAETLSHLIGNTSNNLNDLDSIHNKYEEFLLLRKNYASTINVLANALHAVFSTPSGNPIRQSLRNACFDYLSMGGPYAAGPVGLLSGLTPKPEILATHFFMVAFFGVKQIITKGFNFDNILKTYNLLRIACSIILPLLASEQTTVLSWYPVRTLAMFFFPPIALIQE
eukprot:gene4439-8846_t